MSLPIIKPFQALDATQDFVLTFSWSGNQVFGNQIQIYKNLDNSLVYDNTVTSFTLSHIIPANVLSNAATSYYIKLRVFDSGNNYSSYSNQVQFTTYITPTLSVNITTNQIIQSSNFDAELTYTSPDGEGLNTFQISLYDSGNILISTTDLLYFSQQTSYHITGLENSKTYHLIVSGTTVHGFEISTGAITFEVSYVQPSSYSLIELTNDPDEGVIHIQSYLRSVDGKSSLDSPIYIDNSEVNLTEFGSKVWFDDGFLINGDFEKQYIMRSPLPYQTCINVTNGIETMIVTYMIGEFDEGEKAYFLLEVKNKVLTTRVATDIFDPLQASQAIYLLIRRVDNLWSIKCFDYSVTVSEWNALNLTNDEWNAKNLTNTELRTEGKTLLNT